VNKILTKNMPEQKLEILVPQEVNEIIDAASGDDESLAVMFTNDSVRLVTKGGDEIIREVKWDKSGVFAANLLGNIASATGKLKKI